jgi:sporulation protein YlmC with PRC-barrel domain
MLQLSQLLLNRPILSLRASATIGHTLTPIINPNNLKIEGFYCRDRFDKKTDKVLLYQDIREILPQGIIVNDRDALTDPSELIRLKDLMQLKCNLIGKQVVTVSKQKVGKVMDFATEMETLYIQKLYVSQPIYKNLNGGSLSVDRSQITEITSSQIIINELLQPTSVRAPAAVQTT